jgi:SAM-dependent methyltransferase
MTDDTVTITETVRRHYGDIASSVLAGQTASAGCGEGCCGTGGGCCDSSGTDSISSGLYAEAELDGLPVKAALASLGCGNPAAVAELHPGDVVLDLGSGGGIDVLLTARRVSPGGFAYGLDMTDEMLDLARHNAAESGVTNVEFLKGDIAAIPLPDARVDVILSNCVINLAPDKSAVFAEALRVLKPGGRLAVSDIVIHGGLPADLADSAELRRDLSTWAGCIAGALTDAEYRDGLSAAGFVDVSLEVTRRYSLADLPASVPLWAERFGQGRADDIVSRFAATTVRASKPV